MTPDSLAERIAALDPQAPEPALDVDQAIRAGSRRRRWRQSAVSAGAFACVVAATASIFLITRPAPSQPAGPAITAEELAGRWLLTTLDGHDVTSWRDIDDLPANLIIGADDRPTHWQANSLCGPFLQGDFTVRPDGSFTATVPAPEPQFCPSAEAPTPDILGAIARTATLTVDQDTMTFLDGSGQVIATWQADNPPVTTWCAQQFGAGATYAGRFTTVEHLRTQNKLQIYFNPATKLVDGEIAYTCSVKDSTGYAVTPPRK